MEPLPPPLVYGEYEVLRHPDGSLFLLGEGTSGTTYKGVQREMVFGRPLETFVALKVIKPGRVESERQKAQFYRELKVLSGLRHQNVVRYLKQGEVNGELYYAMEFCGGGTLEDYSVQRGGLTPVELASLAAQACAGLRAVHQAGFVHGDIKPSNLLLEHPPGQGQMQVKLSDFGSVQELAELPASATQSAESALSGEPFRGSPLFASPEQIREHRLDHRSDIYSLGITLWFLILGRRPVDGSIAAVQSWHLGKTPHELNLPAEYPTDLAELLAWMVRKDPLQRPSTLDEIAERLSTHLPTGGQAILGAPPSLPGSNESLESLYVVDYEKREKSAFGQRCPATSVSLREPFDIIFIDPAFAAREETEKHLRRLLDFTRRKEAPPALARLHSVRRFGDDLVTIMEHRRGQPLSALLSRSGGQLDLATSLQVLDQVGKVLDYLQERQLRGVSLSLDDIRVVNADPADTAATRPGQPWQIMLDPMLELPADLRPAEPVFVDSGHTITTTTGAGGISGGRETPGGIAFLMLLYRLVVGHEVSEAARIDPSAFTPTQKLGDQTNGLIRELLCSHATGIPSCAELLDQICDNEGIAPAAFATPARRGADTTSTVSATRTQSPGATVTPPAITGTVTGTITGTVTSTVIAPKPLPRLPAELHDIPKSVTVSGRPWLVPVLAAAVVLLLVAAGAGYFLLKDRGKVGTAATAAVQAGGAPAEVPAKTPDVQPPATPTTTPAAQPTQPAVATPTRYEVPEGTYPAKAIIKVNGKTAATEPLGAGFAILLPGESDWPCKIQFSAPGHENQTIELAVGQPSKAPGMIKLKRSQGKVILSAPPGGTDYGKAEFKFLEPLENEKDYVTSGAAIPTKILGADQLEETFMLNTGTYRVVIGDMNGRVAPREWEKPIQVRPGGTERIVFPAGITGNWNLAGAPGPVSLAIDKGLGGGSLVGPDGKTIANITGIQITRTGDARVALESYDGEHTLNLGFPNGPTAPGTYTLDASLAGLPTSGTATRKKE